ncbi:regulator of G-protein signaling 22-like isoform X3 [Xenia sp. Carnegie-2017]|uniref:regulator of G-protein signaling 22-like isoform X3 n=1 Tax=Xenia sp. Carnegie-2017 TaxID=2897299 RepID=UPI001F038355|nr:regulator of G-protein signaling 22-like isoform X3 [Xenia sp. Carnegie-2017]
MEDVNVELNKENLVEYLRDDDTFVEYFNTFLSLPCFQTRIYYDKQSGLLEEFTQKLVKDDCGNIQKRHDPTRNEVQISYCVTVLDHQSTLKWLQKYRLDEFVRSMIFAEYKLSKALSSAQANYFERITGNISRGKTFITEMKTCGISSKESFNSHLDDQFGSTSSSSTEKQSYKRNDKTSGDVIIGADVRTIDVREDVNGASNDEVLTLNVSGNSNKGKGFDEEEKSKNEHSDDFVELKNDELVKKRNDGDCFLHNTTSSMDSLQYNGISVESDQKINDNDVNRKALLSSKTAMDKFKDFLVDTKGESLLLLWLQIEYWKHIKNSEERKRYVQEMKQQYGSPLELPRKIKKDMLSGLAEDMNEAQKIVEEPLLKYWCKRFTLHEVNISKKVHSSSKMSPSIHICTPIHISPYPTNAQYNPRPHPYKTPQSLNAQYIHRPHLYNTPESLNAQYIHRPHPYNTPQSLNAQYIPRPHSYNTPQSRIVSYSSSSSHWESNISLQHVSRTCNKWKPTHLRSKSARGRKVTTPYHTNAGKRQLEIHATPEKEEFGFQKRPISAFPRCSDVEYFSPIRLVIAPRIAPSLSTVLEQRWYGVMDDARGQQSRDSVEKDETYDVERSLRDSLEYQTESGCFLKYFILKENNKFWSNCLSFWQATRDYSACFESGPFCSETVIFKAKWIYERFLAPGSVCDINVSSNVRENIKKQLDPPYEDLFDDVDDHVLACLKEPWDSLCRDERKEYEMIPKSEQLRYITVKLNDNNSRRKISLLSNELDDQEGKENFESRRYGVEDVKNSLPVPPDGVSFESLMKDREELEGFQRFLEKRDPKGWWNFLFYMPAITVC